MKVYLAGNLGHLPRERGLRQFLQRRLFSYFHILPKQIEHEVFQEVVRCVRKNKNENLARRGSGSRKTG